MPYIDSSAELSTGKSCIIGKSFNVLVVGPTGIGKSTLINSIFDVNCEDSPDLERALTDISLQIREFRPCGGDGELKLNFIETKGFGNQQDTSDVWKPIVKYIEDKSREYLEEEFKVQEMVYNDIVDNRVHCCIFMIPPFSSGLAVCNLALMKQLHQRVCLIPVIAKADVLTKEELHNLKGKLRQEFINHDIQLYNSKEYQFPLAVATTVDIISENGKRHRVRRYPWGIMYAERDSEFLDLRSLMVNNLEALRRETHFTHYRKYRQAIESGNREIQRFIDAKRKFKTTEIATLEEEMKRVEKLWTDTENIFK